jgi:hypothetical protein
MVVGFRGKCLDVRRERKRLEDGENRARARDPDELARGMWRTHGRCEMWTQILYRVSYGYITETYVDEIILKCIVHK